MMMQKSFRRLQFARIIAVLTSVSGPDPDWIRSQFVSESGSRQANMDPIKEEKKKFYFLKSFFGGLKASFLEVF
jgi:hypothetical protein